jgi:predicted O-methyltransferase YrrM
VAKVTFVDHHKPNSKLIMEYAQSVLRERGIEVNDEILIKADASVRMPEAMLQSLSGEGGLVLCGISD